MSGRLGPSANGTRTRHDPIASGRIKAALTEVESLMSAAFAKLGGVAPVDSAVDQNGLADGGDLRDRALHVTADAGGEATDIQPLVDQACARLGTTTPNEVRKDRRGGPEKKRDARFAAHRN